MSLSLSRKRRNREHQEYASTSKRTRESQDILSQSQIASSDRCGKITRIHLENFMCHANLTIDFHRRVNFLVGSNGSGKSAIMAALVLGLGSKARATNRSGSMKQFIKTGASSAKIEITFLNQGHEAFEPETYGDKITVVRNISHSSVSSIIKNESGRIVSRKLDDLFRILVFHNIQTENPVFVLNQESARDFLKELDPKKNYKMFLAATQIELVTEKLYGCLHTHKEQRIRLQSLKTKIVKSQNEEKELRAKLEILLNLEKLKNQLKSLEQEKMWLLAALAEKEFSDFTAKVEVCEQKIAELQRVGNSKTSLKTQLNSEISTYEEEKARKEREYEEHRAIQIELKNKSNQSNQCRQELELEIQKYQKRKSVLEAEIVDLQKYIEDRKKNLDIDDLKKQHESALKKLTKSLQEMEIMIDTTKNDFKAIMDSKTQAEDVQNRLKANKAKFLSNIAETNAIISSVSSSSKDPLSTFGGDMVALVYEIQKLYKAHRFAELPRGPIGHYLQVPNRQYRDLVETQLGNLAKAFIVCNTKDRQTLESIIQRMSPQLRVTIITMKFAKEVYDVSKGRVRSPPGTKVLMDEIKCSDPVVLNCLIDRLNIEAVLLTDNKNIAENICQRENVPVNMLKVLVPKNGLEYFPEPKYRMYSMQIRPGRFIQVGIKQRILGLQKEIENTQNELSSVEKELRNLTSKIEDDSKRIDQLRKLLRDQETKRIEIQSEIDGIKNFEYPYHNDVEPLLAAVSDNTKQVSLIDEQIKSKKAELNELINKSGSSETELSEEVKKLHIIQREIDEIDKNIDSSRRKINKITATFNESKQQLQTLKDALHGYMQEREKKQILVQKQIDKAKQLGERIETERQEEDIQRDIAKIQAKLRQNQVITETVEDLKISIDKKKVEVEMDVNVYEKLKFVVDMLGKSLRIRFYFLHNLKQHMVLLLQYAFNFFLKARDFVGSVEVDHQEQTLVLSVIPRDKHLENALSSTRALSGGERSYATVAFLISLWSCVDHPFYFLDEYDVFTDVVNRESLTQLLLNEGKVRPNRQYTFLTPQDMSLHSNDFVKIHRLEPPERR